MGDGDLGLTMNKGYGALPDLIRANMAPDDIGKTLMKAGMKMAGLVPSTMGTLMASGIMAGGKAIAGKSVIGPAEMADFISNLQLDLQKEESVRLGTELFMMHFFQPESQLRKQHRKEQDLRML